jgi:hypothetical protein
MGAAVGKVRLGDGEAARTACARVLVRGGGVEKTGEHLPPAVVAERVAWCATLVRAMVAGLLEGHWNAGDVRALASGRDDSGRPLPAQAWMALRRLGWSAIPPDGIVVNDRVMRMAQEATIERPTTDPRRALLRLQLPVRPDPRGHRDWEWTAISLILPPTVPVGAVLHLPTLGLVHGTVRAGVAFSSAVPQARRDGHVIALGVDWGLNTLLSAGAVRLHPDGTITTLGAGGQYRASGVLARQHKLRRHGELLQAKADQHDRIIAGDERHPLAARKAVLDEEARRVAERRSNLNGALAWSAARWAVDQAIAAGATVIYLEDLRTLEARGMGRTMNVRLSQTVRGQIAERMRHLAAEAGIAVVTVPAQDTSRLCPGCLTPLRHHKAPDTPAQPGWKWAVCPGCGWQGDRDQGAWQRIAARGLAHQHKTTADRRRATMAIRAVDDAIEQRAVITAQAPRRDRSKAGPTARRNTSRRAPRRRAAPSPPPPRGRGGQRPEGRATTARPPLPRAASRDQGAHATSDTPIRRPHRARGAALGAGFHLHAHATPPRWEPDPHPVPQPQDN